MRQALVAFMFTVGAILLIGTTILGQGSRSNQRDILE